jgi:2-aminoadipate transaminase
MKEGSDLCSNIFAQHVLLEFLRSYDLDTHIRRLRTVYGKRRDTMLECLERVWPHGCRWYAPEGGMFVWVVLPEGLDSARLLRQSLRAHVVFAPGASFYASDPEPNTLRLNFTRASPDAIRNGMRTLGGLVESMGRETSP